MFQRIYGPDPLSCRRLCTCSHSRYGLHPSSSHRLCTCSRPKCGLCPLFCRKLYTCSRPRYGLRSLSCRRPCTYSRSRYGLRFSFPRSLCTYTRSSYAFRTGTLFLSSGSPFHSTMSSCFCADICTTNIGVYFTSVSPISNAFRHSFGKIVSWRRLFPSGSKNDHSKSVLR